MVAWGCNHVAVRGHPGLRLRASYILGTYLSGFSSVDKDFSAASVTDTHWGVGVLASRGRMVKPTFFVRVQRLTPGTFTYNVYVSADPTAQDGTPKTHPTLGAQYVLRSGTCYDRGITFRLKCFVNDGAP